MSAYKPDTFKFETHENVSLQSMRQLLNKLRYDKMCIICQNYFKVNINPSAMSKLVTITALILTKKSS